MLDAAAVQPASVIFDPLADVATTALPTLADPFDLLIVAAIAKIDFGVVAALLKGSPSVVRVYLHRCCENRVRA